MRRLRIKGLLSSVRTHMVLLVLLAIVPCATLVIYKDLQQRKHDHEQARTRSIELAGTLSFQYRSAQTNIRSVLASLAAVDLGTDPERCALELKALKDQFPQFFNIGVADLDGNIVCAALPGSPSTNIADREFFTTARDTGNFAQGTFQLGRLTGMPSVGYGYPIKRADGSTAGVMVTTIDVAIFSRGLAQAALPAGASATLYDRNGVVLARFPNPEQFVGQDRSASPAWRGIGPALDGTYEAQGLDGTPRLYAYARIGDAQNGAILSVGLPREDVFAFANQNLAKGLVFLLAVALFAAVIAALFGEWSLVMPLHALAVASRRLAGGDLTVRSGLAKRDGEVGDLAGAFDRMAVLLERRERIEQEIEAKLTRKVSQLNALHGVFLHITENLSTDDVVQTALDQAAQLVDADVVVLRLLQGQVLEVAGSVSRHQDANLDLSPVRLGEGLMGEIALSGKSVRVERSVGGLMRQGQVVPGAESGLAVPVMIHGNILGTLGCWSLSEATFSEEDQQLLEMFAAQIAVAIAAATARENSDRLARVDSLTGLYNRLQLSEDEPAIIRSVQSQPMMVAMIDIDFFKRFNDEYGHLVGDRVLREVASSLRRVLRSTDRLYRFGGEEFLLLAPCDDEAVAHVLAERVRRSVETHPFEARAGEEARKVTVSVGVALLRDNDETLSIATEHADQALYEAKGSGRNRCAIWGRSVPGRLAA